MTLHCDAHWNADSRTASLQCLDDRKTLRTSQPSRQHQAEEALLRRIKCHLLTELDNQTQTHLKIYVSLAMPTALKGLANDITFHVDDQRHTLQVSNLSGSGLPEENNWLATVYLGSAAKGVAMASVSLGYT